MRLCPACNSNGVKLSAIVAAAVDSDSRCSNCGAGLKFGTRGRSVITVSFFIGLITGVVTGMYWLGVVLFVAGLFTLRTFPLFIDQSDPLSIQVELKKKIAAAKAKKAADRTRHGRSRMGTFSKTYVVPFPLEQVFDAWVAEDTVIAPAERMEIEPRVGGAYRLIMPGGGLMEGEFSVFSRNSRVTYTWNWAGSDEICEVDVRFGEHPDGTEVGVTHSGFQTQESYDNHASGWDSYVQGFTAYLASNP